MFTQWLKSPLLVAPDFEFSKLLAEFDFSLIVYLDDILFLSHMDYHRTAQLIDLLLQLFRLFGLQVHPSKSITSPVDHLDFLGFKIHNSGKVSLTEERRRKVRRGAGRLLHALASSRRFVAFKELRSFAGLAASCFAAVPLARLFVRAIYDVLADYERRYRLVGGYSHKWGLRGHRAKLSKPAERELRFWARLPLEECVTSLVAPSAVSVLYTDAS